MSFKYRRSHWNSQLNIAGVPQARNQHGACSSHICSGVSQRGLCRRQLCRSNSLEYRVVIRKGLGKAADNMGRHSTRRQSETNVL